MPDRIVPKIDNYILDIIDISDRFERGIVVHELPYTNRAALEDLGSMARVVNIRCAFYQNATVIPDVSSYSPTYENHYLFVNHIQNEQTVELHHPKYTVLKGKVRAVDIYQNEIDEYAEVSLEFVEGGDYAVNEPVFEVIPITQQNFRASQDFQLDTIKEDITNALGSTAAGSFINKAIDSTQDMVDQIGDVTSGVRQYVKSLDEIVNALDGFLNDVERPAKSLISTINYATNVPGRILKSVAECVERYGQLYTDLRNSPTKFINNTKVALSGLMDAFDNFNEASFAQKHIQITGAAYLAVMAAEVYKDDEEERNALRQKEGQRSFNIKGEYLGTSEISQVMSVNEIEDILFDVKDFAQDAIDLSRQNRPLKDTVNSIQDYVNDIKLERLRIKEIQVSNAPLHLICTANGLSHQYAERVLKINPQIKNPTFTEGYIDIYV